VTRIAFLSPSSAPFVSPVARAAGEGVRDVSHLRKLELRGALDGIRPAPGEVLLRYAPSRALLVGDGPGESPSFAGVRVYDMTAALAAFEFDGEDALRRLTDLEPAQLPAAGSIARGTWALIEARAEGRFRVFVPQELGHYVVEVVLDTLRGLGR
jgi:hypothetical protein